MVPPFQSCLRQQHRDARWGTIVVTVAVVGGWDRHGGVKLTIVAGIGWTFLLVHFGSHSWQK